MKTRLLLIWVIQACLLTAVAVAAPDDHPNIIFILADDLGYGDPHCYNPDSKIPTPNLDRLAAQGMRFTDAHSGSAVCTPTRYGVLTGRYAWRTRLKRGVLWVSRRTSSTRSEPRLPRSCDPKATSRLASASGIWEWTGARLMASPSPMQ